MEIRTMLTVTRLSMNFPAGSRPAPQHDPDHRLDDELMPSFKVVGQREASSSITLLP
jgi:hypothetical protein